MSHLDYVGLMARPKKIILHTLGYWTQLMRQTRNILYTIRNSINVLRKLTDKGMDQLSNCPVDLLRKKMFESGIRPNQTRVEVEAGINLLQQGHTIT